MENVCGFFETCGFSLSIGYIPREISLLSKKGASVIRINHGIDWYSLSRDDQEDYHKQSTKNGLNWSRKSGLHESRIQKVLLDFYEMNRDPDHFLIAFYTVEAGEILKRADIPRLDMTKVGFNFKGIDMNNALDPCFLHDKNHPKQVCAFAGVNAMQRWLNKTHKCQDLHDDEVGEDVVDSLPF